MSLSPAVLEAMKHPQKGIEMRAWLKSNQDAARSWRGQDNETMMHWAFLSDWALAADLRDAGLDFEHLDNLGRRPMDWLTDRLWAIIQDPSENTGSALSTSGKDRLRQHSIAQITALWALGARPAHHPGSLWVRAGLWDILHLLQPDPASPDGLTGWPPDGAGALHAWLLAAPSPARTQFLATAEASGAIDVLDDNGRSPLWYAMDGWLAMPGWRSHLQHAIVQLAAAGADADLKDLDGVSPRDLLDQVETETDREMLIGLLASR